MTTTRTSRSRLRRTAVATLAAAALVVGLAACEPPPGDCAKDCITFVHPTEGGDRVSIATAGAVRTEVTLYQDAARTQVAGYGRTHVATDYESVPVTAQYQGYFVPDPQRAQLKPATTYWYRARGTDPKGATWTETGSFKTRQRTVTVTIKTIEVADDSDSAGPGELTFHTRANGGPAQLLHQDLAWPSKKVKTLNITRTYPGVMPAFTLQVRGYDDDCSFSTCVAPASAWHDVGGNGDTQWATATFQVTVPYQTGAGTTGSFLVTGGKTGGFGDLAFHVTGTWQVTYAPA